MAAEIHGRNGARADRAWILVVIALLVSCAIRIHRANLPLERDEGEYAYGAQLLRDGDFSYATLRTLKLPGVHATTALAFAAFGESKESLRIALLLVDAAAVALLYFVARPWLGAWTAAFAAVTFAIFGLSGGVEGLCAHAENFAIAALLPGLWFAERARIRSSMWCWLAAGIGFGVAFMMKQPALAFVPLGAALAWQTRSGRARAVALFGLGALTPFAATCAALALGGAFDAFWFCTVTYARSYSTDVDVKMGLGLCVHALGQIAEAQPAFVGLACIGLIAPFFDAGRRRSALSVLALGACGFAAAAVGLHFRGHYFVFLLPAIALWVALGVETLGLFIARNWLAGRSRTVAVALLTLAVAHGVWHERAFFFASTPSEVTADLYRGNPFSEVETIAAFIAQQSRPEDTIAVIGSEPEIPFLARRKSATGFIYMYPLMELNPWSSWMQQRAIEELDAAHARFLVYVDVSLSWLRKTGSDQRILDWYQREGRTHYRIVGFYDLDSGDWITGAAAPSAKPSGKSFIAVYVRKDGA